MRKSDQGDRTCIPGYDSNCHILETVDTFIMTMMTVWFYGIKPDVFLTTIFDRWCTTLCPGCTYAEEHRDRCPLNISEAVRLSSMAFAEMPSDIKPYYNAKLLPNYLVISAETEGDRKNERKYRILFFKIN